MPTRPNDNLPAELTSFVGRRSEISEAKRALSAARLVTLTGVGGVGKTRLALRVAAGVRRAFADGVWLVELAALEDRTSHPADPPDSKDSAGATTVCDWTPSLCGG